MKKQPDAKSAQPKSIRDEMAMKPGDLLKISAQGRSASLVPNQDKPAGLQWTGKALVFVSETAATFGSKVVEDVLTATRKERLGQ